MNSNRLTFSIGQLRQEVQTLDSGRVYRIGADTLGSALSLIVPVSSELDSPALLFVGTVSAAALRAALTPIQSAASRFEVYSSPSMSAFHDAIVRHALPARARSARLLVFLATESNVSKLSEQALEQSHKALAEHARKYGSTVVILTCGSAELEPSRKLLDAGIVSGYASIASYQTHHVLRLRQWKNDQAFTEDARYAIGMDGERFRLLPQSGNADASEALRTAPDRSEIHTCAKILQHDLHFVSGGSILKDNAAVLEAGMQASAATLVFSLSGSDQVPELIRMVHALRTRRGSTIKIAVVEECTGIRAETETLIMSAGANMIFQSSASAPYVWSQLQGLQNQLYLAELPTDIEELITSHFRTRHRGTLSWQAFRSSVYSILSEPDSIRQSHGALIRLRPLPGISAQDVLKTFLPRRSGDIGCCAPDGSVLLYFKGCTSTSVNTAIARAFSRPVETSIGERFEQFNDRLIGDFLDGNAHSMDELETAQVPASVQAPLPTQDLSDPAACFDPKPPRATRVNKETTA